MDEVSYYSGNSLEINQQTGQLDAIPERTEAVTNLYIEAVGFDGNKYNTATFGVYFVCSKNYVQIIPTTPKPLVIERE